jgi:flagellar biosynthesis/type III secretory pathway protein FliH
MNEKEKQQKVYSAKELAEAYTTGYREGYQKGHKEGMADEHSRITTQFTLSIKHNDNYCG